MRTRGKLTTRPVAAAAAAAAVGRRKSALRVTNPPRCVVLRCVVLHCLVYTFSRTEHARASANAAAALLSCAPRTKAEVVRNNRLRRLYSSWSSPACTHALEGVRDSKRRASKAARARDLDPSRRVWGIFRFSAVAFP